MALPIKLSFWPVLYFYESHANLNTLICLIINVRALQRAKSINAGLLSIQKGIR